MPKKLTEEEKFWRSIDKAATKRRKQLDPDKIMALQNQMVDMEPDGTFKEPYVSNIIQSLQIIAKRHRAYLAGFNETILFNQMLSDLDIVDKNLQYLVDYNSMINHMTKKDYEQYLEYLSDPKNARKAREAKRVSSRKIH